MFLKNLNKNIMIQVFFLHYHASLWFGQSNVIISQFQTPLKMQSNKLASILA